MLTAESDYDWPAADEELTVWETFAEAGPQERELWTRHTCRYAYDPAIGPGDEQNYTGFLQANEDDNDLTNPNDAALIAAAAAYGNMEAEPVFLAGINGEATAKDVFGYGVHESIRAARIFLFSGCAWWEVYAWEPGDVKEFVHPWGGATTKFRILSVTKRFDTEACELRCVEVE